jgi:hypothetical protein
MKINQINYPVIIFHFLKLFIYFMNKPETKDEPMPQIPNTPSNNNLFNNISNV